MAGSVSVGRYTYYPRITQYIVLAVNQLELVTEIEVCAIITVAPDQFGVSGSFPFAPLDNQRGIGQVGIAPDMIEMQMRIYHVVNSCRIDLGVGKPRAHFL